MVPSGTKEWPGRTWRLVLADTSHVWQPYAAISQALFQCSHHPYELLLPRSCRCSRPNLWIQSQGDASPARPGCFSLRIDAFQVSLLIHWAPPQIPLEVGRQSESTTVLYPRIKTRPSRCKRRLFASASLSYILPFLRKSDGMSVWECWCTSEWFLRVQRSAS